MPLGPWELLIIVFALLLIFRAKRVPEMGRSLGRGMREFKDGITHPREEPAPKQLDRGDVPAPAPAESAKKRASG